MLNSRSMSVNTLFWTTPTAKRYVVCRVKHCTLPYPSYYSSLTFILDFSHLILTILLPTLITLPYPNPTLTLPLFCMFPLSYPSQLSFIQPYPLLFLKLLTFLYIYLHIYVYTVYVQYITKCMRLEQAISLAWQDPRTSGHTRLASHMDYSEVAPTEETTCIYASTCCSAYKTYIPCH